MLLKKRGRGPVEPPRFYIYISDTKVDMLLGQIPPRLLKRLAAEVTVNLQIVSLKVATRDAPETRFSRVALVSRYLQDRNLIGTTTGSSQYFAAESVSMRWGLIGHGLAWPERWEKSRESGITGIAFFAGPVGGAKVFLSGSPQHVLGVGPSVTVDGGMPGSYTQPRDMSWHVLADLDEHPGRRRPRPRRGREYVDWELANLFGGALTQVERLSFVARRIDGTQHSVFGSPLWVAASPPASEVPPAPDANTYR